MKHLFDDILHIYSMRATEMLTTLLNSERFIQAVQRMLIASLEFRDFLQSSISAALEQLNIPTRDDMEKLGQNQKNMEERLFHIEQILERIEKKSLSQAREKRGRTKKGAA